MESRRFFPLLALAGLFVMVHQVLDMAHLISGVDFATPSGRVRLVTLVWSRCDVLALADILLIAAVVGWRNYRWTVALTWIHLAVGVLLLLAVPILVVSAGGMANTIGGEGMGMFRVTIARALFGLSLAGIGALVGWRALSALAGGWRA